MKSLQKQLARVRALVPVSWRKAVGWSVPLGILSFFLYHADETSKPDSSGFSQKPSHLGKAARPAARKAKALPDTKPAERALSTGNASDKEYALRHLLPELMARDIAAAAEMAEKLEPWAWREEILFFVAREWARQDPATAAGWARRLTNDTERGNVLIHVCMAVSKEDPMLALDLAEPQRPLQEQILQVLAARDLGAAICWAGKSTDPLVRQASFARIALGHAETSPRDAARLVAEHLASGPLQDETALAVLHKWILLDPGGARDWVDIFPDGALLETAESELAAAAAYAIPR